MDTNTEKTSIFKSILGLISFSTILPLNVHISLDNLSRMVWTWPIIHFFVGALGFITAFICLNYFNFNSLLVASCTYAFILIFTGFHHTDGLMDMADGVMVHGDPERKISVMKDHMTGAGGIVTFFIVAITTVLAFASLIDNNFLIAIIVSEMASKISLLTTCLSSKSLSHGMGMPFIKYTNKTNYLMSVIIVLAISFLLCSYIGLIGIVGGILSGSIISLIAKKNFKVANGDVLGASNEFGRMLSLLIMVIFIGVVL